MGHARAHLSAGRHPRRVQVRARVRKRRSLKGREPPVALRQTKGYFLCWHFLCTTGHCACSTAFFLYKATRKGLYYSNAGLLLKAGVRHPILESVLWTLPLCYGLFSIVQVTEERTVRGNHPHPRGKLQALDRWQDSWRFAHSSTRPLPSFLKRQRQSIWWSLVGVTQLLLERVLCLCRAAIFEHGGDPTTNLCCWTPQSHTSLFQSQLFGNTSLNPNGESKGRQRRANTSHCGAGLVLAPPWCLKLT